MNLLKRAASVAMIVGLVLAIAGLATYLAGCKPPETGTWTGGAISCASDAVRHQWAKAYPEVQTCLVSIMVEPSACLDAIPAAISVGIEVVACVVKGTGQEAKSAVQANPDDVVSKRKLDRADKWLIEKSFVFVKD